MKTVVLATDDTWEELSPFVHQNSCIRVNSVNDFDELNNEDVLFNLTEGAEKLTYNNTESLIFISSSLNTLQDSVLNNNVFRLNSWKGFLRRDKWEVAGTVNIKLSDYLASIKKEFMLSPDLPGFISSRIISMIINEAYFTLGEGVSTKQQIDVAMKLGTNYPKGPFEWSEEIGLNNVHALLNKLSEHDERYKPAPLLIKELLPA